MTGLALPAASTRSEWTRASTASLAGLMAIGVLFTAMAGNRFNVGLIGWIAAVPWLLALRRLRGWREWAVFFLVIQLGTFINIAKIITEPIPVLFAPMFSVPTALGAFVAYAAFEALRRRLGDGWGIVLFPAFTVALEGLSYSTSDMGSWGSLAYSQLDNLPLLQVTSLFGLGGVSLLLALVSVVSAVLIERQDRSRFLPVAVFAAGLVVLAHTYGSVRLDQTLPGPQVTVATVTTDLHMRDGAFPEGEALAAGTDELFARTAEAVSAGAEVVVWNEGATAVAPEAERPFLDRAAAFTREHGVDVLFAYVIPLTDGNYRYENKYVWMTPEGPVETYLKHHPVPGEGAVPGTAPHVAHDRPYGKAAGAICYDYDFPQLSQAHAAAGTGLALIPSSDWRGIDPYHSQMAAVRGIEGGYSVVRSVRWATSLATDALGRVRGSASYFEGERILLASVPTTRIPTLYSQVGDVLPIASGLVLLIAFGAAFRPRQS
ncbi:MAG: nitrilase-related carbon-nitrogen hydrolase [Myxococcota bacterium]